MAFDQIVVLIGETDEFPSIKKHFDDMKKKEDERGATHRPIVTGKQIGRASCRERVCQYV